MDINKSLQIKLIYEGENEIKDNIIKMNNIFHKNYGLLDKDLFNNYQKFLNSMLNDNKIQFSLKFDNFISNFENQSYNLLIPRNIILVNEQIFYSNLNYFDKNAQNQLINLIYEVFIGGECLIIKDKKYNNVYYVSKYNINNYYQYNNGIDYILIFKDTNAFNDELNKIMQKGFSSYLNDYNMTTKEKFHDIHNSKGLLIGRIIYNFLRYTETMDILEENGYFKYNQILHLIMCCLFRTTELVNKLYNDCKKIKTIMVKLFVEYFQNIQYQKDCSKVNFKLNSQFNPIITDNYKNIISEMFSKLDKELTQFIMKDTYKQGQINQFSETSSKEKINEGYRNGSIVKKLFYTIFEIKATCNCGISNYIYEFNIFLNINLDKENKNVLISDKFLNNKKPINIQCHFCGQKINNQNENKIIIYPKILIVILEGTNYNNFSLKKQREIIINNRIYQLYCLCEINAGGFYFKNSKGWYAYTKSGICKEFKGIEATKPAILFYNFSGFINNRNNINQNINYYYNNNISLSDSNINKHINLNNQINNKVINNMNQMKNNNNNNNFNNNIINNNMNNNIIYMNNNNSNNIYNNGMYNNFNNNNMNINNNYFSNDMNKNFFSNNVQMNNNFNNNNMNFNMNNNFFSNNVNMNNNFYNNNMNFNMNNNFYNNNMNINMNNFNYNKNNIPISKSQNIFLTFFLNGKQLFIESNQNETFQAIISKLEKKYNWVKGINKKAYLYNNQVIDIQYTLKQLNIPDNSNIYIVS